MPHQVKDRLVLVYKAGYPKEWFTHSRRLIPDYMRCLLRSEELFERGLEGVPHYRVKFKEYTLLLTGKQLKDLPAIAPPPARMRPEQLQDNEEPQQKRPHLDSTLAIEEFQGDVDGENFVDGDFEAAFEAMLEAEWLEQMQDNPQPVEPAHPEPPRLRYHSKTPPPLQDAAAVAAPSAEPAAFALQDVEPPLEQPRARGRK